MYQTYQIHQRSQGWEQMFAPGDSSVPPIVVLFFVFVVGMILFAIIRALVVFVENSNSPVVTIAARVVTKRTEVSRNGGRNAYSSTTYYVTFEGKAGERRELPVKGHEFGLLAENDRGSLTYQGTWFKDFVRAAANSDK